MNANELADELEAFHADPDGFPYMIGESIAMLRQFDLAESIIKQQQSEIEALKKALKEKEELAQAWILYATKIEMLMPTMCDTNIARDLGWSIEYLKGYNDAIREVKRSLRKAQE